VKYLPNCKFYKKYGNTADFTENTSESSVFQSRNFHVKDHYIALFYLDDFWNFPYAIGCMHGMHHIFCTICCVAEFFVEFTFGQIFHKFFGIEFCIFWWIYAFYITQNPRWVDLTHLSIVCVKIWNCPSMSKFYPADGYKVPICAMKWVSDFYPFMGKIMGKIYSFFQSNFSGKKIIFSIFSICFPNFSFFHFHFFLLVFVFSFLFHSILSLFTEIVFFLKFVLQIFHKLHFQLLGSNSGHLGACHRS
jgi:hypothetical protein